MKDNHEDSEKYADLINMFGGQLHNDWTTEYGTWENAIDDYCERERASWLLELRAQLRVIINAAHDEVTLREIVTGDLYANIYAPGIGLTYQTWLEKVDGMLMNWVEKKRNEKKGKD